MFVCLSSSIQRSFLHGFKLEQFQSRTAQVCHRKLSLMYPVEVRLLINELLVNKEQSSLKGKLLFVSFQFPLIGQIKILNSLFKTHFSFKEEQERRKSTNRTSNREYRIPWKSLSKERNSLRNFYQS